MNVCGIWNALGVNVIWILNFMVFLDYSSDVFSYKTMTKWDMGGEIIKIIKERLLPFL